jgi:hypothetical protein
MNAASAATHTQPVSEPISPVFVIFAVSPYLLALGAISAFLYVYLFRDKASRGVLIGWGVLLMLHLLASRFFFWL